MQSIISIDIFLFQFDVVIVVLYNFSTTQLSLKSVKWRLGLTSHHCIRLKVELALSILPQQGGNLCTWNVNHNWSHVLDTLEFHSMDKTLQFQQYVHQELVVLLLHRWVVSNFPGLLSDFNISFS